MPITARACELAEIAGLRDLYRAEMDCQIIHDSIHTRRGWTEELAIRLDSGEVVGYGSIAVGGPWRDRRTLYEFFVLPEHRTRMFEAFEKLREVSRADTIETQSNGALLATMMLAFGRNVKAEAILFEDSAETRWQPKGALFRVAEPGDRERLQELELDDGAGWVVTCDGEIAGAGGVLYHYNRPYGDVYMKIGAPYRQRGLGAYLVQELKAACRKGGSVPAARCNVDNVASRMTLQRAGFVPCGVLMVGDLIG